MAVCYEAFTDKFGETHKQLLMRIKYSLLTIAAWCTLAVLGNPWSCSGNPAMPQNNGPKAKGHTTEQGNNLVLGCERTATYVPALRGKRVGVVAHAGSVFSNGTHLVDSLVAMGINVVKIFGPEHGFRGEAGAGDVVADGKDQKTGLPVVSLYGKNKKPTKDQLHGIDVVVLDLQDVGTRFYTYISTMSYVLEACAESNLTMVVLDRPNPNGHFVDGPILEPAFKSFVGMHPVPVVHGLTMGEYARMAVGEGWITSSRPIRLEVVSCLNYRRTDAFTPVVKPSPNLPNRTAIILYPSLCFFEGTAVSVGRGTDLPFQCIGAPWLPISEFQFTPVSKKGAPKPKYEGEVCNGFDLRQFAELYMEGHDELYLYWLKEAYSACPEKDSFFTPYFNTLAGTDKLRQQIEAGESVETIQESWKDGIREFRRKRIPYLLYPDSH